MDGELLADQPLGQKLIKKGFWLYFFMIITAPAGYLIRVLISNSISVEDVGIIYSVIGFIGIISAYHDLGLTEALQYHLPKYRIQKKYNAFKTSIYFTLIVQTITGLIIAFILFFGANFLATHYFHSPESANIIKIFCLYFLGINFYNMLYSIFTSFQDVAQAKLLEFIRYYATLIFIFCFFIIGGLNIINFTRGRIIGILLGLIISGIVFVKKYRYTITKGKIERDTALLKKQIKYALWVFIGANVAILLSQVDLQFVIYFLGPKNAGYYSNYLSLVFSFAVITGPLLGYIFPLTTELVEKQEHEKIKQFKKILYKYFSLFAITISGLFFVLGPEIATILFGQKFIYSGELLRYSAPFLIFYVLFNINFGFLAGMGKVKQRAKMIFIALVINIILNAIFIQFRGIIGVLSATMISWIILFYLSHKLVNHKERIDFDWAYLAKNIIGVIIICIGIYCIKDKIFILEDSYRYKNLIYIVLITLGYYLYILGINYKNLRAVKNMFLE